MTIKEKMHGVVAVLSLKGNLMGEPDTENLRDKIYSLLQEGFTKIVVDMKGVRWISSTGLGTLIAALTSVRNKSGDFAPGKYHREGRKSVCHYTIGKSVQDLRNLGSGHCKL